MAWDQIEATPPHLTYLLLSGFLVAYSLFPVLIRDKLHLSEPPIALLFGILIGPKCLAWLSPDDCGRTGCRRDLESWGWGDNIVQETTRIVVGIQVFTVGISLPKYYASKHWKSVLVLLGPVMTLGWCVCAGLCILIFRSDLGTALVVGACLTPTDPVLAAAIISRSQFSSRIPQRVKDLLAAESGFISVMPSKITSLSLCFGNVPLHHYFIIGLSIGTVFNRILRYCENRGFVDDSSFTVFYLLLAIFSIGIASTLGVDDFLVTCGVGYGFARDGWFQKKIASAHLPETIDLLQNSAMFVYLGTIIPWTAFSSVYSSPTVTIWRLLLFSFSVLVFRRLPLVLASYRFIPDLKTFKEAAFVGWFGPMGLGALFLAIEARAVLETGTAHPLPNPPTYKPPYSRKEKAIEFIWPVIFFVVLMSVFVHGLSVLVLSLVGHLSRDEEERAPLLGGETENLHGMVHDDSDYE